MPLAVIHNQVDFVLNDPLVREENLLDLGLPDLDEAEVDKGLEDDDRARFISEERDGLLVAVVRVNC